MSEWKEFEKESPGHGNIWVSDGKKISLLWDTKFAAKNWIYWLAIEEPELPKRKFHKCCSGHFMCVETALETLFIEYDNNEKNISHARSVVCCPFCGYSSEKKS